MALPKTKVAAATQNPRISIFYSVPKIGKTTVLAELEDNLMLECDPRGADHVDAIKVDTPDWKSFYSTYVELKKEVEAEGKRKFITLDTITPFEDWMNVVAVSSYKQTTIGKNFTGNNILELPQGSGYYHSRLELKKWIMALANLCEHLIIVAHVKDKIIQSKGDDQVSVKDIQLTGKSAGIVCSIADAIGYMYRDFDENLCVSFKGSENVTAGSRCKHLRGQDIMLQKLDESPDWSKIYLDS